MGVYGTYKDINLGNVSHIHEGANFLKEIRSAAILLVPYFTDISITWK